METSSSSSVPTRVLADHGLSNVPESPLALRDLESAASHEPTLTATTRRRPPRCPSVPRRAASGASSGRSQSWHCDRLVPATVTAQFTRLRSDRLPIVHLASVLNEHEDDRFARGKQARCDAHKRRPAFPATRGAG